MAIENTAGVKSPASSKNVGGAANDQLNKEAFMKLLVAELKNQDPMNPMESKEMVAQLSQLTSVEKLEGIDSKLATLAGIGSTQSAVQNAALIGKRVEAESTSMRLTSTQKATGSYELLGDAASVQIGIHNAAGELVRQIDLGAQKMGQKDFQWDGTLDNGMRASNGNYTFELAAKSPNGATVATSTKVAGLVSEVTYENGTPEVIVGGARVSLGDVTSIAQ